MSKIQNSFKNSMGLLLYLAYRPITQEKRPAISRSFLSAHEMKGVKSTLSLQCTYIKQLVAKDALKSIYV